MKNHHFILILLVIDVFFLLYLYSGSKTITYTENSGSYYTPMYVSKSGEFEPVVNSPIPMKDRVLNKTGSQCVWSSIETLGKWVKEPKLDNLTDRPECRSNASIRQVTDILNQLDIDFEQSYNDPKAGIALIKKSMDMKIGCLWNTSSETMAHTMVMVHYDEAENVVKFIDNSDSTLKVQTITVQRFHELWGSWILLIYPPHDEQQLLE